MKLVFQIHKGIPLRLLLVVPFLVQIFATVSITGYLSFKNSRQAIDDLANQLMNKTSELVDLHLNNYLTTPYQIIQSNIDAIEQGMLNLQAFENAGSHFWKQVQIYDISYIGYALTTGEYVGAGRWLDGQGITIDEISPATKKINHVYATDSQGNRTEIVKIQARYNPLQESWYIETVKAGKTLWSPIYNWDDTPELIAATINSPIYDNERLIGVIGVDLLLSNISDFLRNLNVSPSAQIFIIERNGLLVASSSSEKPFTLVNGVAQRLNVLNSKNDLIQATAKNLKQKFNNFQAINTSQELNFLIDGERQLVRVTPWQDEFGLDWLLVISVPESDFIAQINTNTRITIVLCLAALFSATLLGLATSRWITRPISRLSEVSTAVANGDFNQPVDVKGIKELAILSQSFNRMAQQLQVSFHKLDQTNQELEIRVEQRTIELKQAKEVADRANHAKRDFLANISHELRTPLNTILGFTQLMQQDSSVPKSQQENLSIISRSGEHLLSLINDVLDMSKIEAGRISLNPISFDFYRLLDNIKEMLRLKADSKRLQLLFERTPEVPQYIYTDERKLRQVLINLLDNALKFTEEGGVTLRVSSVIGFSTLKKNYNQPKTSAQEKMTLYFEIEDTGVGIALEEFHSLFEPFVQTDAERRSCVAGAAAPRSSSLPAKPQEGIGLGLAISYQFIQLMEGDLKVSSTVGEGTLFRFEICVESATVTDIVTPQPSRRIIGLEPGQSEYRILVVDDRWENRLLLLKLLKPIGFKVREATNGQEAIAQWQEWKPHLIWMDMRMPVMNGYEATQTIKAHLQGQATIIIALTASAFEEEKAIVLSAGCDDFMRKPFREEILFEKMAHYLGIRYIYQNQEQTDANQLNNDFKLESSSLQIMSTQWLMQLKEAADQLDEQLLMKLLAQIPHQHTLLAKALTEKVRDFEFEQIIDLVQQATTV